MIRLADESITFEPGDCSDINAFKICKQKICDNIKKSHRNALVEMKRCRSLTIQYTATRFLQKPDYEFIALVETTSQSRSETDFKSRYTVCTNVVATGLESPTHVLRASL